MLRVLLKSHEKLDRAVEKSYGRDFTADLITESTQRKTRCKHKPEKQP